MARRGRPPHPDVLTPREWEVLALLREGLSNEEIAERLGITLAGAKYHVSEILGKLGVASREEAARWRPEARPWWAAALAPIALLPRKIASGWLPAVLAGAVAIAVAAGIGVLVWALIRTSGGGHEAALAPTATRSAASTASTTVVATPTVPATQATVIATGNAGGADWSPDGRALVYALDAGLYIAGAPDFARRLLATPTADLLGFATPRWSPDGTRIAFLGSHPGRFGNPNDSSWTIGVVNSDGTGLRDLLPGTAADLAPTNAKDLGEWLDDRTIVFYQGCGTACRAPYLIDTTSGSPASLIGSQGGYLGVEYFWSPDKRLVAAVDIEGRNTILILDAHGEQQAELPRPPAGFNQGGNYQGPWQLFDSWSPDSVEFVYEQLVITDATSRGTPSLRIYNVATGQDRELASLGRDASWSPDGKRIAYVAEQTTGRPCGGADTACVAVVDAASRGELFRVSGPDPAELNAGDHNLTFPAFLPDGRLVYEGGQGTEIRLAADGESKVILQSAPITNAPASLRWFVVSPDGRYVVAAEAGLAGRVLLARIPSP